MMNFFLYLLLLLGLGNLSGPASAQDNDCDDYCGENSPHIRIWVDQNENPLSTEKQQGLEDMGIKAFYADLYEFTDPSSYAIKKNKWAPAADETRVDPPLARVIIFDTRDVPSTLRATAFTSQDESNILNFKYVYDFLQGRELAFKMEDLPNSQEALFSVTLCDSTLDCVAPDPDLWMDKPNLSSSSETTPTSGVTDTDVYEGDTSDLGSRALFLLGTETWPQIYYAEKSITDGLCEATIDPSSVLLLELDANPYESESTSVVPKMDGKRFCILFGKTRNEILDAPYCTTRRRADLWQFDFRDLNKNNCLVNKEKIYVRFQFIDLEGQDTSSDIRPQDILVGPRIYPFDSRGFFEIAPSEASNLHSQNVSALLSGYKFLDASISENKIDITFQKNTLSLDKIVLHVTSKDDIGGCKVSVNQHDGVTEYDNDTWLLRGQLVNLVQVLPDADKSGDTQEVLQFRFGNDDDCFFIDDTKSHTVMQDDLIFLEGGAYAEISAFVAGKALDVLFMGGSAGGNAHGIGPYSLGLIIAGLNKKMADGIISQSDMFRKYRVGSMFGNEIEWSATIEGSERLKSIESDLISNSNRLDEMATGVEVGNVVVAGAKQIENNLPNLSNSSRTTLMISLDTSRQSAGNPGTGTSLCQEIERTSSVFLNELSLSNARLVIVEFANSYGNNSDTGFHNEPVRSCIFNSAKGNQVATIVEVDLYGSDNSKVRNALLDEIAKAVFHHLQDF